MGSDYFHPIFQYEDWQKQEEDGHYPVQPRKKGTIKQRSFVNSFRVFILHIESLNGWYIE